MIIIVLIVSNHDNNNDDNNNNCPGGARVPRGPELGGVLPAMRRWYVHTTTRRGPQHTRRGRVAGTPSCSTLYNIVIIVY